MLAAVSQRTAAARAREAAAEHLVPLRADPGRARYQLAWLTGQRSSSLRDGYLYWMGPEQPWAMFAASVATMPSASSQRARAGTGRRCRVMSLPVRESSRICPLLT
jgi:hypothetical protein